MMNRREVLNVGGLSLFGLMVPGLISERTAHARELADVPHLGDAQQLFVDLSRVEKLENIKHVFHAAQKHPANPVLRKQKAWETLYGTWGTVIYDADEGIFKTWYGGNGRPTGIDRPGFQKDRHVLCYATSTDGVDWNRPELGLHSVAGATKNNVVVGDEHHEGMDHWETVLKDPADSDPQRRYKAIGWSSYDWDGPLSGIYTMTSPDGLHWTHTPEPVFRFHPRSGTSDHGPVGDAQSLMIDPLRRRYVAMLRTLPHRSMSESSDFVHWTPPKICLNARPSESSNMVYNHMGFVYGDQYLGFLTYFDRNPQDPLCTVRLLSSRDGDRWDRPTDKPIISAGDVGEPDRFLNMLTGGPPIRVGDKLHIYYRTLAKRHGPYEGKDDPASQYPGGLSLATLRVDGFASLGASYDSGIVTTKSFRFSGRLLRVNVKADFGRVTVEALNEQGEPISGFARTDCHPLRADNIEQAVSWKDHSELRPLADRAIRLRFHLENARIYSYRIV